LEGEASIKIDTLRDRVLHVIGYRPFEAERRVYIIDPAEEMGDPAQSALLKTLEEPPPATILILVSAYPDTLLPTVQSRCRRLRLASLSEHDVARVLAERCAVDRVKASTLAAVSGGSVSRALAMADDDGQLAEDRQAALALVTAAAGGRGSSVPARLKAATALTQHAQKRRAREALGTRLAVVASIVRDLGVIVVGGPATIANTDFERELRGLASSFDLPRLSSGFAAVARAQADLDRSASPKIVADWVALTL
jgi:DNA polymerase-3 subunit delta'